MPKRLSSSTSTKHPRPRLPPRTSSLSTKLPRDLERFLALYPHPAFALRASSLYDALVGRKEPHAPRPVDLAGAGAGAVPSYGGPGATTAATGSRRQANKPGLSSQEQYEGGVDPDSTPSPVSDDEDDESPPSTRAPSAAAAPAATVRSGETDASHSSGADTDSSSLGPSASQVASPKLRSPALDGSPGPAAHARLGRYSIANSLAGSSLSKVHSSASGTSQRRAADAGDNPRAHARAERILASAFDSGAASGASGSGSRGADGRKQRAPRGSYLEGGAQKSHDPSRTAEGAVKAMYEQRERQEQDDKDEEEATAERESGLEAERLVREQDEFEARDRWSGRRAEESQGSGLGGSGSNESGSTQGNGSGGVPAVPGGLGLRDLLTPVWRNGKWREMMAVRDADGTTTSAGNTPKERDTGVFAKANGEHDDGYANTDDNELELLSLLSRADLQECLAMFANVVAPLHPNNESETARQASVPLAQLDHTVLLELHFPESSIYRHPPGSSFHHRHTFADSGRAHGSRGPHAGSGSVISSAAGSGSTTTSGSTAQSASSRRSIGRRGPAGAPSTIPILPRNLPSKRALPIYSPQNAYDHDESSQSSSPFPAGPYDATTSSSRSDLAPPPNQNPAVEAAHRGVGQIADTLFPFLQVVATLQPDTDLVICTAILANMPLPVTVTGSPEKADKAEVRRDKRVARAKASAKRERERESRDELEKAAEAGRRQRRDEHKVRASDTDRDGTSSPPHPSPVKPNVDLPPPSPSPSTAAGRDLPPPARPLSLSLPPQPSFGSPSPFPDGYKPSRPPLTQRSTSYSSISGASSGGSTVVGRPSGTTSTPENRSPRDRSSERFGESGPQGGSSSSRRHSSTRTVKATSSAPSSRRGSHDRGLSPSSRDVSSSAASIPAGLGPPSPQPPQHYAEPTYAFGSAPLQTPSVSDELKELWVDNAHRNGRPNELPRGFVQEKESRAAVRRRAGAAKEKRRSDERAAGMGESDNDIRERERRRQSKKRDKEWRREQDERDRGHEGLGDLAEQDEPAEGDDDPARKGDAYDDVLGFDEEDTEEEGEGEGTDGEPVEGETDTDEMARLRVRMRTGSTSSDGSAHEREQAHAEAHRAQAQQEAEQRRRDLDAEKRALSSVKTRSDSGDDRRSLVAHEEPQLERRSLRDAELDERLLQQELDRPEDESRLVLESPARGIADPDASSSTGSSSDAESMYGLGLTDGPSSASNDEGVDGQGNALVRVYGDPFLDTVAQTACGRVILSVDWAATSLGDIRSWNGELRSHVMAILASPFHTALWMGADNVLIYNDAYARLLGPSKHPAVLGKSGAEGWSELWDVLGPLASQVFSGRTLSFSDHCNCIMRNGMLEETYHSWAYITIRDSQSRIMGYVNPSFETTARVIAERRLGTLRELTQLTQLARTLKDFCAKALRGLSGNALDVPFAILYTCEAVATSPGRRTKGEGSTTDSGATRRQGRSNDSTGGRMSSGARASRPSESTTQTGAEASPTIARMRLTMQGSIGVPTDHPSAVDEVTVLLDTAMMQDGPARSSVSSVSSASGTNSTTEDNSSSTVWPFIEALQTRKPVFISELGDRTKGFPHRGWPDEVRRAVLMPIITEGSSLPKALLIVGLNPRRPFNAVMAQFFNLVSRTLSTGLLGIEVAEEQARKSRELSELNDARQAFFANISHELRTPLTLILGPLEDVLLSKSATLDAEDRDRLEVVQRNAHRLLNMVNTLLDFSRLESGKMNTTYRPTLLGPRTADLAALFRSAIERGGIEYNVEIDDDKWAKSSQFYLSDEVWEKVIFNLIGNAFKYTPPKPGARVTVKVSFTAKEGIVSVADTGVGINDADMSRIFDRFHRVDSAARSFEGTGIGLSLVLELVKALGGTITVQSKVDEGSTFTVRLPRGHAHLEDEVVNHEPYEMIQLPPRAAQSLAIINDAASWRVDGEGKSPPSSDPGPSNEKRVVTGGGAGRPASDVEQLPSVFNLEKSKTVCLVVDDNAQLRSFIGKTLSKSFAVVEKSNGKEAFEYAKAHPEVSIVVTDLAMPVMSGRELLAALRQHPETSLVPVIFLSAQAGSEARVDALLLGADDYIVKPFQARELLARVNVHLQLGHMRKELERRVTERTAALIESEKKLKELAEQHQTLALVSPVGIFQCDTEGKMVFVNPRYFEISQHPTDAPLDQFDADIHPEDVERVRTQWHDAIANWRADKPVSTFEYRYKAGNWAQLEVRSFDKGYIGSITDISHQKEVEAFHIREVEQRAQEAEENRRNTEIFLDMSSHELRNPLSGVWQNAEVVGGSLEKFVEFLDELRHQPEVPLDSATVEELHGEMLENVEAIESIMLCASHQTRIADDILNVSKLNMGLLTINVAPFDLVAAVREVVKTFEVQSHQQQIKLAVEKGPSLSKLAVDWIVADSGRIKQVTYNFLTNALKYTVDSTRKTVTVHVDVYDGPPPTPSNAMRITSPDQSFEPPEDCVWCVVGIEDSGKGLSAEQLKLLFARFSQANPKSDQYGGSGLGLYVSKKLVELHRGFIEVESQLGRGSTFRFAIPAPRTTPPPVDEAKLKSPTPTLGAGGVRSMRPTSAGGRPALATFSSTSSASSVLLAPFSLLIVDDNAINRSVMKRQLKLQNFEVTTASDGQEALDILMKDAALAAAAGADADEAHNPIRCVLMDIEMPVMDGMSAVRELRRREKAGEISRRYPVCAVTGNARDAQKRECLAAGFDDIATKPYRLTELLQQVSALTGLPLPAPK
ncbi:uncharacterized protein RHOBADRAFT_54592 [Rhodotorula graminis WP1]|uniref:Histidine kinase domain-containing protein n=1 Tax=Rhodotorula graminis (strain WP1) TaxID=578459 RepID=A0A0N8Q035_RHOGW|nr:uncharacterized protein RHOBADRAFT_54592 [Rhodotorula graminis WP1]KPV74021.1 hypothetical protein RHOBADRAFT_54592 [Rhodotorula graminis WP1]